MNASPSGEVPAAPVAVRVADLALRGPAGAIVTGLSFALSPGATLAIVGESGSGKTLTARALSGLLPPGVSASGRVIIGGRTIELPGGPADWRPLRGQGVTLLVQDPFTSLSPSHRCGHQIAWGLRRQTATGHGPALSRSAVHDEVSRLLKDVNLSPRVAKQYPGELSGGMRQRVAIAAALAAGPVLMIADEPTTALDASNQRDVLELLARLQREHGMAMVLISHQLALVRDVADDVLVMYAGRGVEYGPAAVVLDKPAHPYTAALRSSELPVQERLERLLAIPGRVPAPGERGPGCAFAPRCQLALPSCPSAIPPLKPLDDGRLVACFVATGPLPRARSKVVEERSEGGGTTAVLQVERLVKSFPGVLALGGVTLEVPEGGAVGIVGESGSGKTTLARCIAGLEAADSGRVVFRGVELTPRTRRVSQLQMVFQDPYSALNPKIRIGSALAEAARTRSPNAGRVTPETLLELVGLPTEYVRKFPGQLSGGERQRVAIARSLGPGPELLVCDEPVSALDLSVQAQVLNLLADLRQRLGLSLLFISHDLAVVRQVSDTIHVIHQGCVVEYGPTRDVLLAPRHDFTQRLISGISGLSVPPDVTSNSNSRVTFQGQPAPEPSPVAGPAEPTVTR